MSTNSADESFVSFQTNCTDWYDAGLCRYLCVLTGSIVWIDLCSCYLSVRPQVLQGLALKEPEFFNDTTLIIIACSLRWLIFKCTKSRLMPGARGTTFSSIMLVLIVRIHRQFCIIEVVIRSGRDIMGRSCRSASGGVNPTSMHII